MCGASEAVEPCPRCGNDMQIIGEQGNYGVRCPHCRYAYGNFEHREYMIGAWNALATVFPASIQKIVESSLSEIS